jgi:hypothetical protein
LFPSLGFCLCLIEFLLGKKESRLLKKGCVCSM